MKKTFDRDEVLKMIKEVSPIECTFSWYDGYGDFEGRDFTLDVYGLPLNKHLDFLRMTRDVREKIRDKYKRSLTCILHTISKEA